MTDARSPKTISGLVGWYTGLSAEVTSGSVSSWKDISGQGNHATTIQGSPKVESTGVTSPTPGEHVLAFHYGNFDDHYEDVSRANAAKAGRIYADTLSSEIPPEFGSLVSGSTASGQTTYTWFPPSSVSADVLVVAGGGGGGAWVGGGGGAGGFKYEENVWLPENVSLSVTVGDGGRGEYNPGFYVDMPFGLNGYDSSFGTISSSGGGRGGSWTTYPPLSGGSGGGAGYSHGGAAGITGEGFAGGNGRGDSTNGYPTGGGGGAGGVGGVWTAAKSGNGGVGKFIDIFGETYGENGWFAGGGGGGVHGSSDNALPGDGGIGGGGDGLAATGVTAYSGLPHTGGGGGGSGRSGGDPSRGGDGGSGIVIARIRVIEGRGQTQFPFLYGGVDDGLTFPTTVMSAASPNYTLFHVARYYNPTGAPTRGRIFDGLGNNWLSGFWNAFGTAGSGMAFHEGWVTPQPVDLHGNQWVLSTDQRNRYRSNGTDRTNGTGGTVSTTLTINNGSHSGESSHWAVAEVIVYNRELTLGEYLSVEAYLSAKYFDNGEIPQSGVISGSLLYALFYTGTDGGYPLRIPRFGQRIGVTLGTILRASHFRGVGLGGAIDTVPLPAAAYSLRRLFYSYGGPQVRVRRSTDNVEADIFMDKDGVIVTIENSTEKNLTTWLGGAIAYAVTWYDQGSQEKHTTAYGTSTTTFPSLVFENGKYAMYFPGSSATDGGYFNSGSFTFNIATKGGLSTFSRVNFLGANTWERVYDYGNASANNNLLFARIGTSQSTRFELFSGNSANRYDASDSIVNNTWHSFGNRISGSGTSWTFTTHKDGTEIGSSAGSLAFEDRTITNSYIGRSNWSNDSYANMYMSDLLFFDTGGITDAQFTVMENALY